MNSTDLIPPFDSKLVLTRYLGGPGAAWPFKSEAEIAVDLLSEPGFGLRVVMRHDLCSSGLDLLHPAFEKPAEIGYLDYAHGLPNSLRIEEFETVCTGVSPLVGVAHPFAVARLLLSVFTLVSTATEQAALSATVEAALAEVGFDPAEIAMVMALASTEGQFSPVRNQRWEQQGGNWIVVGDFTASMRTERNPEFPHTELAEVMARFAMTAP